MISYCETCMSYHRDHAHIPEWRVTMTDPFHLVKMVRASHGHEAARLFIERLYPETCGKQITVTVDPASWDIGGKPIRYLVTAEERIIFEAIELKDG